MSFYEKAKEAVNEYVDNAKKVNAGNPRTWAGSNDRAQQNPGRAQVAALRAAEAKPSRSFINPSAVPAIKEYLDQTRQYDAGRPTTPTAGKPGLRVAQNEDLGQFLTQLKNGVDIKTANRPFDASQEAKPSRSFINPSAVPAVSVQPSRQPMLAGFDASQDAKINSTARPAIGDGRSPIMGGTDLDKMQQSFMQIAANNSAGAGREQAAMATSQAAEAKPSSGFVEVKTGTNTSGSQLDLNRLYPDFTGAVKRAAFHTNEPSPAEKQAEILARQVAFGKNVNPDARPESRTSLLLNPNATERNQRSAPAETPAAPGIGNWTGNYAASGPDGQGIYKDTKTGRTSIKLTGEAGDQFMASAGNPPAASADEMASRRQAMGEYSGMFGQQSPTPQQQAEQQLARKQMEVMGAERADKGLLQGPGTRDYIDPRLSVEQQRARQNEITAQRQQDMRDARDSTIAQAQARDAARAYNGLPTDEARNRAMEPYAERRATINARNNMAEQIAAQAALTAAGQTADKDRQAQVAATNQADATTRRAQDIEAESSRVVAESQAREKALDRQATLQAAQIKADGVKDPIMLKQIEGYNNALAKMMETPGTTISDEDIQRLKVTFGLINDDTRTAAVQPY